jgi:arsenate reductase
VHWAIDDPAAVEPLDARRAAFERAFAALEKRIKAFLAMDLDSLSRADLLSAAAMIHEACQ